MKKLIALCLLIGFVSFSNAQQIRLVPTKLIKQLPNGWHKFVTNGVVFDVEISEGSLVKGNIKWLDNSTYSGSFANNVISGRGTYTWANGDKYEGSFKNNERHGKGSMYWKDGTKYSGKWKNNKKNGKGKMWEADGTLVVGLWEENKLIKSK